MLRHCKLGAENYACGLQHNMPWSCETNPIFFGFFLINCNLIQIIYALWAGLSPRNMFINLCYSTFSPSIFNVVITSTRFSSALCDIIIEFQMLSNSCNEAVIIIQMERWSKHSSNELKVCKCLKCKWKYNCNDLWWRRKYGTWWI